MAMIRQAFGEEGLKRASAVRHCRYRASRMMGVINVLVLGLMGRLMEGGDSSDREDFVSTSRFSSI